MASYRRMTSDDWLDATHMALAVVTGTAVTFLACELPAWLGRVSVWW